MRFPACSGLLCRHNVLLKTLNSPVAIITSRPASSLSAIHKGLRQSQKSRPQGFDRSSLEAAKSRRPPQGSRRSRDPDWTPPTFKIKRGKKDVTDTGPEPQSRRSRFNDPEHNFGKRSLVYQMKHGALREKVAELEGRQRGHKTRGHKTPSSPRAPSERMTSNDFMKDFNASAGQHSTPLKGVGREPPAYARKPVGRDARARFGADPKGNSNRERIRRTEPPADARKPVGQDTRARFGADPKENSNREHIRRTDNSFFDTRREGPTNASPLRTSHESFPNKPERLTGTRNGDDQAPQKEQESRNVDDGPIRIHHTTAASQFLYGRSVVEAALKNSRRQLYRLYIYDGDDRRNVSQDDMLAKLAYEKGVKIIKVPNNGLNRLDKMSGGRPHNGCVLEASPLPQPPLKALGPLSENITKPGFYVEMTYQSSEEAKVNGTSDFVSYHLPKERKPFILLLDGILDPGNLGAILRTAAFLGVNGIAITKSSSATLTAVALKASAGASEVITLFSVNSAMDFLTRSKENGWLVYAAVPATKRSKGNSHLTVDRIDTYDPLSSQPTVLVIGSEGEGLTRQVRRQADHEVSIPSSSGSLSSVVDSLNVSVATGILCSAFLKKQTSGMMEIDESPGEFDDSKTPLW
ncbi:hypothetical protein ANO14919_080370 [Xylariales sp. No.14919]|nr:hypothetical protein ANO14919_080370 [Xylariales sp. No.14919]